MTKISADAVIFRTHDGLLEGYKLEPTFVQVIIDGEGGFNPDSTLFDVGEGDTYRNMKMSQIFFVKLNEDKTASTELCSFTITNNIDGTEERTIMSIIEAEEFPDLIRDLTEAFKSQAGSIQ